MKRALLLCLITGSCVLPSHSQMLLGFGLDYYKPTKNFARNLDQDPIGISLTGLFPVSDTRWTVGTDMGVAMYAHRTFDYISTNEDASEEMIEIYEEDCFLHLEALLQYKLYENRLIRTYVQFKTGFNTFFSTQMPEDDHSDFKSRTEFHGTSLYSGLGTGISLNMTNLWKKDNKSRHPVYLDFTGSYLSGTRASYRSMNDENSIVSHMDEGKFRSLVNNLNFKLGVSFEL